MNINLMQGCKLRRIRRCGERLKNAQSQKKQKHPLPVTCREESLGYIVPPTRDRRVGLLFENMVGDPEKYLGISVRMN